MNEPQTADDCAERALFLAVLRRAFDDLEALRVGARLPYRDAGGRPLTENERRELFGEALEWFFAGVPSPMSLENVCAALGLDVDVIRDRARDIIHRSRPCRVRRRKLTAAQIDFIVAELARGRRTPELARDFRVDPSTIRKVRIKNRARIAAARRAERRARIAA